MAITPGYTSGTRGFSLSNSQVVVEAFDRIQIRPMTLTRHHMASARNSINLELLQWSNVGVNLWEVTSGAIYVVAGKSTYALSTGLVTLTDVWVSTPQTASSYTDPAYLTDEFGAPITDEFGVPYTSDTGAVTVPVAVNSDRYMTPITRQQYAMIPNKQQTGTPTQYWVEMTALPTITLWPVPAISWPDSIVNWFGLQRMEDANLGMGESPDIVYRAYDALCARLAWRLAVKFQPGVADARKKDATEAWNDFATRDQEQGRQVIQPNVSGYWRIG
jgi:hypothetical protein